MPVVLHDWFCLREGRDNFKPHNVKDRSLVFCHRDLLDDEILNSIQLRFAANEPVKMLILGDWGVGNGRAQQNSRRQLEAFIRPPPAPLPRTGEGSNGPSPYPLPEVEGERLACQSISARFTIFCSPKHRFPIFMRPTGRKKFILMQPVPFGREAVAPRRNGRDFTKKTGRRHRGRFHFAGSGEVLFTRDCGRTGMKTRPLFGLGVVRPNRWAKKTLTLGNLEGRKSLRPARTELYLNRAARHAEGLVIQG